MFRLSVIWTLCLILAPILLVQGLLTRRKAIKLPEATGVSFSGDGKLSILTLGDSVVAGVGVKTTKEALPAQVALQVEAIIEQNVSWRAVGFNGDRLTDLLERLKQQARLGESPDLVMVNIGVNDTSGLTSLMRWQLQLTTLVSEVERRFNVPLVFVGLPPMGQFPLLPQPLRFVLGTRAAMLDLSLRKVAELLPNVYYVPLNFAMQAELMAEDGYHPSASAVVELSKQIARQLGEEGVLKRFLSTHNSRQ